MKSLLPLTLIAFAVPALLTGCNRSGDTGSTASTDTNTAPADSTPAPATDTNAPAATTMSTPADTNAASTTTPDTNIAPSVPSK